MKAKSQKPFFSVVIPTLNEELFLPTLLTSLSKQNFKDFEIIVVDGRSEDKTVKITRSFSKKVPKLTILNFAKRHVSAQRNLGGRKAGGKYLLFFDADSNIDNSFLSQLHQTIKKNPADFFSSKLKSNSSKIIDRVFIGLFNLSLKMSLIINRPIFSGAFIGCKKNVFLKVNGFDEAINMAGKEDNDFNWRCSKNGLKAKLLEKPRFFYSLRRFHQEGYLKVLRQWAIGLSSLLKKTHHQVKFDYPMGGHLYQEKSSKF